VVVGNKSKRNKLTNRFFLKSLCLKTNSLHSSPIEVPPLFPAKIPQNLGNAFFEALGFFWGFGIWGLSLRSKSFFGQKTKHVFFINQYRVFCVVCSKHKGPKNSSFMKKYNEGTLFYGVIPPHIVLRCCGNLDFFLTSF